MMPMSPTLTLRIGMAAKIRSRGGTIPSFRNVLAMEKKEWKPFRDALDMKAKEMFD